MSSRKTYEAMAAELLATREQITTLATGIGLSGISQKQGVMSLQAVLDDMTRAIARVFADENPRFDYRQFMDAATPRVRE